MASLSGGPAQPRPSDSEHAIRLLHSKWVQNGKITSAAFCSKTPISMFVKERLPREDGSVLNIGRFTERGRAKLKIGYIRLASCEVDGIEEPIGFDLSMTGSAREPLEEYGDAHANLEGPSREGTSHRRRAARALAASFNAYGCLEKLPEAS